jgi:glycosyltransferase involved in cell wall biosynthesis
MADSTPTDRDSSTPLSVFVLNWRDTRNPEGGGSERYIESIARRLAAGGHRVTVLCAAHPGAPRDETVDDVTYRRRGSKLTVYPRALQYLWANRRTPDVVVDVQNGVPFFSRLATRRPVVVLVHHVHREQWPVVYGPAAARFGWWLESWLAPRFYRGCQYVAVSEVTKRELAGLGVRSEHVAVVHNGTDRPPETPGRSPTPTLCVLGRLVPHKRVELALHVAAQLRDQVPSLRLLVVGDGWWSAQLRREADRLGVSDITEFCGFVTEADKHQLVASSWVHLAPSLKEGWGLNVMEAASHGVPTVAFDDAGGLSESVVEGVTGRLVPDLDAFSEATGQLLSDDTLRVRMGTAARDRALTFHWGASAASFGEVLRVAVAGTHEARVDPGEAQDLRPDEIDLRDYEGVRKVR